MKLSVPVIATILYGIYLIIDFFVNDALWDASVRLTNNLDANEFKGETFLFNFFTYIVFLPPLIAFIAFIFMDCKLNVLTYFAVMICSVVTNELLKNIYHQPRPYMSEVSINP